MPVPNYVKLSWANQNLALAYIEKGQLDKGRKYLLAAEEIAVSNVPDDVSLLATIRMNLGESLIMAAEPDEAFKRLNVAQASLLNVLGESHPRVIFATRLLGNVAHQKGELDTAEELYNEALRMAANVDGGSRNKLLGIVTTYLGDLSATRGEPDSADALYRKALIYLDADLVSSNPRSTLQKEYDIEVIPVPE